MNPGSQAAALALIGLVATGLALTFIGKPPRGTDPAPPSELSWAARIGMGSHVDSSFSAELARASSTVALGDPTGRAVDVRSCTDMGGDPDSCVKVVDLVKIAHAAGEPLDETQVGPVLAALSAAKARLPARTARPPSAETSANIRQMQQHLADIAARNASFQNSVAGLLSPSQMRHFEHYLDEERELAQVDLDVALENAARK